MADGAWPSVLPTNPTYGGYGESPSSDTIRTGMGTGPDKVRPRSSVIDQMFSVAYEMDDTQVQVFEDFWHITMKAGSRTFTSLHPRRRTTETFRFKGPYRISPLGNSLDWVVQFEMEQIPS